jgi:hypothetical protein
MKNYTVEITETLQRTIEVTADDKREALIKAKELYRAEEVVLDASDHVSTTYATPSEVCGLGKEIEEGVAAFDDFEDACCVEMLKAVAIRTLQLLRDEFIKKDCTACGGNWTAMILSGIKKRWPEYYETMPDKSYSFMEAIEIMDNKLLADWLLRH